MQHRPPIIVTSCVMAFVVFLTCLAESGRSGVVVYDSLNKVFMNAACSPDKLDAFLQGQPDINLSLMRTMLEAP